MCRQKVQQIQAISPNQFFTVQTKGTFQSQRSFGLSYNWSCTRSTALICHQARVVTTELLLHHRLFCHQNQQAGVATQTGICTQTLQQATWEHAINQGQQHMLLNHHSYVITTYTEDDLRRGFCLIQQAE